MRSLTEFLEENAEIVPDLQPSDLAWPLLRHVKACAEGEWGIGSGVQGRPVKLAECIGPRLFKNGAAQGWPALVEAWSWLLQVGLIALNPSAPEVYVARCAMALDTKEAFEDFARARLLPTELLDEDLRQRVMSPFLQGDYDTAVFKALKKVEISVRGAVSQIEGTPCTLRGVDLMRHAFRKEGGPLDDRSISDTNERGSYGHMFAGVFGCYRNPTGHRDVEMVAEEAVEIIMTTNHLLRIVDTALARNSTSGVTT
jgi:uncharacterized protein (TIGR02391 family)